MHTNIMIMIWGFLWRTQVCQCTIIEVDIYIYVCVCVFVCMGAWETSKPHILSLPFYRHTHSHTLAHSHRLLHTPSLSYTHTHHTHTHTTHTHTHTHTHTITLPLYVLWFARLGIFLQSETHSMAHSAQLFFHDSAFISYTHLFPFFLLFSIILKTTLGKI